MDNVEVIGIDNGWQQTKTAHHVFPSGVTEILSEPAFFDDVLEWNGKYYKIGTKRDSVMNDKTESEDCYLLTLAAIAKELKSRGKREAKTVLAVGLPATRFGVEKKAFKEYLKAEAPYPHRRFCEGAAAQYQRITDSNSGYLQ